MAHHDEITQSLIGDGLVIFYGAGINYAQRPAGEVYQAGAAFLPTGSELAEALADATNYPNFRATRAALAAPLLQVCEPAAVAAGHACGLATQARMASEALTASAKNLDLARVAQHADQDPNYNLRSMLHTLFSSDVTPTAMHQTLAALPEKIKRESNLSPIYVTTNYDVLLEEALAARGRAFDVIYYWQTNGPSLHYWKDADQYYKQRDKAQRSVGGADYSSPIPSLSDFGKNGEMPPVGSRPVIVKFHGSVAPKPKTFKKETLVITSDDYINFLRSIPLDAPLPALLLNAMREREFLFLGYGLGGDWNILALCQNLWHGRQSLALKNWAVQFNPSPAEVQRWSKESRGCVTILDKDLTQYSQLWDLELAKLPTLS